MRRENFINEETQKRTVYLGDGAWMRVDGFQVVVWTDRGAEGIHYVAIPDTTLPTIFDKYKQVMERFKK